VCREEYLNSRHSQLKWENAMRNEQNDREPLKRSVDDRESQQVSRRNILLAGTTLAAASALSSAVPVRTAQAQQAGKKPNVVIMLADNVGYGDVGAYGAGEIRGMPTPRLDRSRARDCA
jgi:hypothetical protein